MLTCVAQRIMESLGKDMSDNFKWGRLGACALLRARGKVCLCVREREERERRERVSEMM